MDLIGSITHMENRLGGRTPEHGKGKPAPKHARNDAAEENNAPDAGNHSPTAGDTGLGQKVDTSA